MKKFIKPLIWFITIIYLSLLPKADMPDKPLFTIPHFDKLVHFGMYFIWVLLIIPLFSSRRSSQFLYLTTIGSVILIGGSMEIFQELMQCGRSADITDMYANLIGGISALLMSPYLFQNRLLKKIFSVREFR